MSLGLPYKSPFQPYMAWATVTCVAVIALTSGYVVFLHGHWNTASFLTAYIGIPIFLGSLGAGIRHTSHVRLTAHSTLGGLLALLSIADYFAWED